MLTLPFLNIDPILIELGPVSIRWYGLAYVAGILMGWRWMHFLFAKSPFFQTHRESNLTALLIDQYITAAILGIVIGGRLGYVLFYNPQIFITNPLRIIQIWEGGMSFHGGLIGTLVATYLFCRRHSIFLLKFTDLLVCAAPIGLFFGRLANFINGELYGRITDVAWAVVFPSGGPLPRHPSQLYEALLEGVLLFVICNIAYRIPSFHRNSGKLSGLFLIGYSISRIFVEFFREPDAHIGFLWQHLTMGQILSFPLLALGLVFLFYPSACPSKTKS